MDFTENKAFSEALSQIDSVPANKELEEKLKKHFGEMLVYKSSSNSKFFSALSLPSYMRDWLVMRFSNSAGKIDKDEVSAYVKRTIPKKEQWNEYLVDLLHNNQPVRFLTKIKIDFDTATRNALFSLPDFGVPKKKGEAIVDWSVIEANREYLLSPTEVWGIVELVCELDDSGRNSIFRLVDFTPFCPYTIDLDYFIESRNNFSVDEWIDVLIGAIDYNPAGYASTKQKLTMISRLLPFIEKRLNLIELAPKETGKSYLFAQISKYGWLVSGGSISRAKMFYDINKKTPGLVSRYDYVAFDEVQSIKFTDAMEMQGALKGYLESGEYRVGDSRGVGDAGLILLGNIDSELMNINQNMFVDLPDIFHESALLDRFHGFIKGWDIPKMKESLKANGWALNTEYFGEIMHMLREELSYRAVVDELLELPKNSATRDTEAIKRICTGLLKLLFPNATDVSKVDVNEFITYCLEPAKEMRSVIKMQLGIIDYGEFGGSKIPDIQIKECYREKQ
ncbi:MAG: BREX system Lon protease-like protein BrxL [Clostridia bacterium]|nr:BREX system Lon protease-like protein BrxL [Clostridia bacterium]